MTQEDALPEILWPTWEWVLDTRGIAVASVLGVLSYLAPLLEKEVPRWVWIGMGTLLVLLWLLVPLVVYVRRAYQAVRARHRQYPIACEYARKRDRELEQAQQRVNEMLPYVSVFEIKHVLYETVRVESNSVYIVVAKKKEISLKVGDNLRAIDETTEQTMGVFEISQEREQEFFAIALKVDPLWLGSIYMDGRRQQYPPVSIVAKLMGRRSS